MTARGAPAYGPIGIAEVLRRAGEGFIHEIFHPGNLDRPPRLAAFLPPEERRRLVRYRTSLIQEMLAGRIKPERVYELALRWYRDAFVVRPEALPPAARDSLLDMERDGWLVRTAQGLRLNPEVAEAYARAAAEEVLGALREMRRRAVARRLIEKTHEAAENAFSVLSAAHSPEMLVGALVKLALADLKLLTERLRGVPPRMLSPQAVTVDVEESVARLVAGGPLAVDVVLPEGEPFAARGSVLVTLAGDLVEKAAFDVGQALNVSPRELPEADLVRQAERALREGRAPEETQRPLPVRAPGL